MKVRHHRPRPRRPRLHQPPGHSLPQATLERPGSHCRLTRPLSGTARVQPSQDARGLASGASLGPARGPPLPGLSARRGHRQRTGSVGRARVPTRRRRRTPRQRGPGPPTVAAAMDGALAEDHDVLREGARLVGEDVLHLAQLLAQRGGAGLRRRAPPRAEHLLVPVDEVAVAQADDLHAARGTGREAGRGARPARGPSLPALGGGGDRDGVDTGDLGGEGEESLPAAGPGGGTGSPRPRPSDAVQTKKVQGAGRGWRADGTGQRDEGLRSGRSAGSYLGANNRNHAEKTRESARGKGERERETMRVLRAPRQRRRHPGRGRGGRGGRGARGPGLAAHIRPRALSPGSGASRENEANAMPALTGAGPQPGTGGHSAGARGPRRPQASSGPLLCQASPLGDRLSELQKGPCI